MNKIRTPDEYSALIAEQKEYEKSIRSAKFNKSVTNVVELVRAAFVGKSCIVPLEIVYPTHDRDGCPTYLTFVERDKEVINAVVDLLREEFFNAGWTAAIYAKTPIWPFTTKIIISLQALQYVNRPPKK